MTHQTRRQRKRAANLARKQELLVLRMEMALLFDSKVPQHLTGLNAQQTRRAIAIEQQRLTSHG
jgi:hypothetical protein